MIKVLLVEDEKETADSIARLLSRRGFSVDVAYDLATAINRDLSYYDMVLLDILLKGERGFPLLEKMKKEYPAIPVIIVTAYDNDENVAYARKLGADAILTKPVTIEYLADFLLSKIQPPAIEKA